MAGYGPEPDLPDTTLLIALLEARDQRSYWRVVIEIAHGAAAGVTYDHTHQFGGRVVDLLPR